MFNDSEICYDIERNFLIEHECIFGTTFMLNVEETDAHVLRIRGRTPAGTLIGKWSQPVCISLSASPISLQANYTVDESRSDSVKILFILKSTSFQNTEHFCHSHIHSTEYFTNNDSQLPSEDIVADYKINVTVRYDTNTDLVFEIDLPDYDGSVTVSLQIPNGAVLHAISYIMNLICINLFFLFIFFVY